MKTDNDSNDSGQSPAPRGYGRPPGKPAGPGGHGGPPGRRGGMGGPFHHPRQGFGRFSYHEEDQEELERRRKSLGGVYKRLTPGQIVILGFALLCFVGGAVLTLPCMNVHGYWTNYIDALFTATSACCVTGLVVLDTGTYWSLAGQLVIIFLIQVGGLGFMTMMSIFFVAFNKRVSFHDRQVLQSSVNADSISGIMKFIKKIPIYAFSIEAIGGILLATVFVPKYGWVKGIYFGFWHAISMYCNAGFDLIGNYDSFVGYVDNWTLNLTVMLLIVIGGIGFGVYVDITNWVKDQIDKIRIKKGKLAPHRMSTFSLNSKIVLITTGILLFGGALLFYLFEKDNPDTMGSLDASGKFLASFFQSVTPRTAGANTIDQGAMTPASKLLTDILMLIGGSPGSTAGGIKTTCIAVMVITLWSVLMGKTRVNVMHREIPYMTVRRALCVFIIALLIIFTEFFILLINQPGMDPGALIFEIFSAFDTVGLTCGITRDLGVVAKLTLTLCMYIGRVGPMTLASVLYSTEKREKMGDGAFKLPEGNILIG